jgi:OHCU decarboxylase
VTPIETLNTLPREAFAEALKPLFETAPPLADALYAERPFGSYAALIDRAEAIAAALPESEQITVVNAHPRIGESAARMSAISAREQGASSAADAELARLNAEYEARHGFRFVVFVDKRPRSVIADVLRTRLANSRHAELRTALREMFRIARDRLSALTQ